MAEGIQVIGGQIDGALDIIDCADRGNVMMPGDAGVAFGLGPEEVTGDAVQESISLVKSRLELVYPGQSDEEYQEKFELLLIDYRSRRSLRRSEIRPLVEGIFIP